jgi:hypothetical protein
MTNLKLTTLLPPVVRNQTAAAAASASGTEKQLLFLQHILQLKGYC